MDFVFVDSGGVADITWLVYFIASGERSFRRLATCLRHGGGVLFHAHSDRRVVARARGSTQVDLVRGVRLCVRDVLMPSFVSLPGVAGPEMGVVLVFVLISKVFSSFGIIDGVVDHVCVLIVRGAVVIYQLIVQAIARGVLVAGVLSTGKPAVQVIGAAVLGLVFLRVGIGISGFAASLGRIIMGSF